MIERAFIHVGGAPGLREDGVRLTTRLIEGEFPNYRQLIPSNYPNCLIVGREPLSSRRCWQ